MKYRITTESIAITEYIIEANSQEEAEELYLDADNGKVVDYMGEHITNAEEADKSTAHVF